MSSIEMLEKALRSKEIVKVGGAFDAMSAKLVEISGFDAIWAGSFAISATHALPDASIMTMTEFLNVSASMAETCKIPIIADCDTGFGGPSNVRHMIKKYENAGIAGISIEDKIFPKQNSLLENGKQELILEKEFVAKIIAARESKQDQDFMIIARTEALIAGMGTNEALKRAYAYEKAGASAILIHSKKNNPSEIFEFSDMWKGSIPLVVVPTSYPSVSIDELISHEIKMVIYANQSLRIAHASMLRILKKINESKKLTDVDEKMSSMEEIFHLQKISNINEEEKDVEKELKKLGYIT
jgi:phosphoenolpyruvate phosphomutase